MLKKTLVALSVATVSAGAAALPLAAAHAADTSVQIAACAPANPCAAAVKKPVNPCSPCAAKNPCAAANPCAAKNPCQAASPCAPKIPNPCAAKSN